MAPRITYEIVKQFFQDVFVPQLEQISDKLEDLRVELRSIRTEMRDAAQTVLGGVRPVRNEMNTSSAAVHGETLTRMRLDHVREVRERLAALEGKMRAPTK
jgi:hypothetical protein